VLILRADHPLVVVGRAVYEMSDDLQGRPFSRMAGFMEHPVIHHSDQGWNDVEQRLHA